MQSDKNVIIQKLESDVDELNSQVTMLYKK